MYDLNRCPQNEDEATQYIYSLFGRTLGSPANDWASVFANSNLPRNVYTPGMQADASWPYFGFTQMWGSNGPRGRIFVPAAGPDENGFWTRQIQLIADGATPGTFIWAWQVWSGKDYKPVQGATGGGNGPVVIVPGGGLTKEEVQAMIDAATKPMQVQIDSAVKLGDKIALKTNSGLFAGIKGGGPTKQDDPIDWIGKEGDPIGVPHAWESLEIVKGE